MSTIVSAYLISSASGIVSNRFKNMIIDLTLHNTITNTIKSISCLLANAKVLGHADFNILLKETDLQFKLDLINGFMLDILFMTKPIEVLHDDPLTKSPTIPITRHFISSVATEIDSTDNLDLSKLTGSVNTGSVNTGSVNTEPTDSEILSPGSIDSEPINSEPINSEPVDLTSTIFNDSTKHHQNQSQTLIIGLKYISNSLNNLQNLISQTNDLINYHQTKYFNYYRVLDLTKQIHEIKTEHNILMDRFNILIKMI
jgi:hypothetical protein